MTFSLSATEEDTTYFNFMRNGGKAAPKPRNSRGITTPQLMKFFNTSCWKGYDETSTVSLLPLPFP